MLKTEKLYQQFLKLKTKRETLEPLWKECYEFALPQREGLFYSSADKVFDGTCPDAVDCLSASLLSELTPAWHRWFDLTIGADLYGDEAKEASKTLEHIANVLQAHFDKSAFIVELHQCFLDLVTVGTACLLFEEDAIGANAAFRFSAVPLSQLYVEEGAHGRLDTTFRAHQMSLNDIQERFKGASLDKKTLERLKDKDARISVIEAVVPNAKSGYDYTVFTNEGPDTFNVFKTGHFTTNPFITFRWQKAAGEVYGRSPVMKALPDIKTANKVVELVLKNATIAVTGIWQAEDDGVLNPANIRLIPGAIIPKAVGSKGLVPLQAAGNFDVSQLVLTDLRSRIRHAMLVDKLGEIKDPKMTATEVMERSNEMLHILGATYSRLQNELLRPVIMRGLMILRRRGEIPEIMLDGRLADVSYTSPLARQQSQSEAGQALSWLSAVASLGDSGMACLDVPTFVRWLGETLHIPMELLQQPLTTNLKQGN